MATTLEPAGAVTGFDIAIVRIIDASPERVWRAWTEPEQLKAWFGPKGFSVPVCEVDLRVGGQFRLDMQGPDGTIYPGHGRYLEIVAGERLVYSDVVDPGETAWGETPPPSSTQIITFEDLGGTTRLTITMRMATAEEREAMAKLGVEPGWQSSLDCLDELLAAA